MVGSKLYKDDAVLFAYFQSLPPIRFVFLRHLITVETVLFPSNTVSILSLVGTIYWGTGVRRGKYSKESLHSLESVFSQGRSFGNLPSTLPAICILHWEIGRNV
jgi:hypothetical protein